MLSLLKTMSYEQSGAWLHSTSSKKVYHQVSIQIDG
jgi:hypothetical protein